MIAGLVYRALRLLSHIIIIVAVIMLLSKILPFAGDVFRTIRSFLRGIAQEFDRIKTLLSV